MVLAGKLNQHLTLRAKSANIVDFENTEKMKFWLQNSASIQPRTRRLKFADTNIPPPPPPGSQVPLRYPAGAQGSVRAGPTSAGCSACPTRAATNTQSSPGSSRTSWRASGACPRAYAWSTSIYLTVSLLANFRGLVLGCIEANFCDQRFIFQKFYMYIIDDLQSISPLLIHSCSDFDMI